MLGISNISGFSVNRHKDHPNEPSGLIPFMDFRGDVLPGASNMNRGAALTSVSPARLLTVQYGPRRLTQLLETNTPAGTNSAAGNFVVYDAFGPGYNESLGPTGPQWSKIYECREFMLYGNGTNIEVPNPGIKFGYWGVTNNDKNHGPSQIYGFLNPSVSSSNLGPGSSPSLVSEFTLQMITQNGSNILYDQNLNKWKHVVVGTKHKFEMVCTLGTAAGSNGTWNWWLDGIHIGTANTVPFIDPAFASSPGTGISGFWGVSMSWYWGGSGAAIKTRDDPIYVYNQYFSGIPMANQ